MNSPFSGDRIISLSEPDEFWGTEGTNPGPRVENEIDRTKRNPADIILACGLFSIQIPRLNPSRSHSTATASTSASRFREAIRTQIPLLLQRISATKELVDDIFLTKWIEARGEDSIRCLEEHALWREQFLGPQGIDESDIANEIAADKVFLQQGHTSQGDSILLFFARKHIASSKTASDTMKLMAYAIDTAISSSQTRKVCCIFDLSGIGTHNLDFTFLKNIFHMLQTHYPNSLRHLYFVNVPFFFWGVWKCLNPFISPNTKSKVEFLSGKSGLEQLHSAIGGNEIASKTLPDVLGGNAELVGIHQYNRLMHQSGGNTSSRSVSLLRRQYSGVGRSLYYRQSLHAGTDRSEGNSKHHHIKMVGGVLLLALIVRRTLGGIHRASTGLATTLIKQPITGVAAVAAILSSCILVISAKHHPALSLKRVVLTNLLILGFAVQFMHAYIENIKRLAMLTSHELNGNNSEAPSTLFFGYV